VIPFDFEYHRPAVLEEAASLYARLAAEGKQTLYYTGGTEIITLGRLNLLRTGAVIDVKAIPQCRAFGADSGRLVVGAALSLNEVADSGLFPLLGQTAGQIADRTARNKITLGGNLCSAFIYREAVLPLLVADAALVLAGPAGVRTVSVHEVFTGQMRLRPGEFIVQVHVPADSARLPFVHTKKRRSGPVGYPIVTLAALQWGGQVRAALSGVCDFPFRSRAMETVLNDPALPAEARAAGALEFLPAPLRDDVEASAGYRAFVLRKTLLDALRTLEGGVAE
jgi:xanthine dehydrogenase molybdenum-binding subunit